MSAVRECFLLGATGTQGVGKTYTTMSYLLEKYMFDNPTLGTKARKILIIDFNDEYSKIETSKGLIQIKTIPKTAVLQYASHPSIDVRRISPLKEANGVLTYMTLEEKTAFLIHVLNTFRNGCILIEDINTYIGDTIPIEISSAIVNVRHRDVDVIMHYQSFSRLTPKLRQNTRMIRFHYEIETVDSYKSKLSDFEIFKIAQLMVNKQYHLGNERFFVYIDRQKQKITGRFSKSMIWNAIQEYIMENPSKVSAYEKRKDINGKKMFNYQEARTIVANKLLAQYNGNFKPVINPDLVLKKDKMS